MLDGYETAAEDEADKIVNLKEELKETDEAISDEMARLSSPEGNPKLNVKVSIGVFADLEGAINTALIYGVSFFFFTCLLLLIWENM